MRIIYRYLIFYEDFDNYSKASDQYVAYQEATKRNIESQTFLEINKSNLHKT